MPTAAELQRQMFEVIERKDLDALRALYHPDYVYLGADGVEQPGADAGVAVAQTYLTAFADLNFEVRHQFAPSDDVAILEFTGTGTHSGPLGDLAATGRKVRVLVCNIVEARDGLILREREYFDTAAMLAQLGAIPAQAAAPEQAAPVR